MPSITRYPLEARWLYNVIQEPIHNQTSVLGLSMKLMEVPSHVLEIAIPRQKKSLIFSSPMQIALGTAIDSLSNTSPVALGQSHRAQMFHHSNARSTSQHQEMPKRREAKKQKLDMA